MAKLNLSVLIPNMSVLKHEDFQLWVVLVIENVPWDINNKI